MRDLASLNRVDVLPWDVWGAMPAPDEEPDLAFFDELADLLADGSSEEVRARYVADDRLRVPSTVFNTLRDRCEPTDT